MVEGKRVEQQVVGCDLVLDGLAGSAARKQSPNNPPAIHLPVLCCSLPYSISERGYLSAYREQQYKRLQYN